MSSFWRVMLLLCVGLLVSGCWGDSHVFRFVEDASIDGAIAEARNFFIKTRPSTVTRLDAVLLLPEPSDKSGLTWRRGSFNPDELAYPASCVKLTYLSASMQYLASQGLPYTYLDDYVRPMIMVSSNLYTGTIVDIITGTPNNRSMTMSSPEFLAWVSRRRFTANYLDSRGLLENQTILHKTYPTNSGSGPEGAEALARELYGMNLMCPRLAASLMLEISQGALHPATRDYMLQLLVHVRWDEDAPFGFGLPPGTRYHNKPGSAYNDLNDIAYIELPNGQKFVLAAFSDSLEYSNPWPYTLSNLGVFAERLIDLYGLCKGCPPKLVVDCSAAVLQGEWTKQTNLPDIYGDYYLLSGGAQSNATFTFPTQGEGLWEIAVWAPQHASFCSSAAVTIISADGAEAGSLNLHVNGGRFVYMGDYYVTPESRLSVVVSGSGCGAAPVAVSAVKATQWPSCNGVVGVSCSQK